MFYLLKKEWEKELKKREGKKKRNKFNFHVREEISVIMARMAFYANERRKCFDY